MLAITTASSLFVILASPSPNLSRPRGFPVPLVPGSRRKAKKRMCFCLSRVAVVARESFLGFSQDFFRGRSGFARMCKGLDCEGDLVLEAEILEFMKFSKNPELFPSKKELVDAGRIDLVDAIKKRGGWLALGWDLDEEEADVTQDTRVELDSVADDSDESFRKSIASGEDDVQCSGVVDSSLDYYFQVASSSGKSIETVTEEESGIEGILSRLGKQRNLTFGFGVREHVNGSDDKDNFRAERSEDVAATELRGSNILTSMNHNKVILDDLCNDIGHNRNLSELEGTRDQLKPESPITWAIPQAGIQDVKFKGINGNEKCEVREGGKVWNFTEEDINQNQLRSRLQLLESELSTVLHSLRSNADDCVSSKVEKSYPDDLQKLSDDREFQETEIMNAKDKLRSLRAKLTVVEGKMALAIIDAQKMVEDKHKRLEDASRTLKLLRTTCIVWPNFASEVLLAGSFDGWATQRKMEKSSTGISSLCLKLYPGRYEIKFIVDGKWKIDPLRPVVNNNGYENNVLVITLKKQKAPVLNRG